MLASKFPHGGYLDIPEAGVFQVTIEAVAYPKASKAQGLHVYLQTGAKEKYWLWVGKWHSGKESPYYLFFKECCPVPTGSPNAVPPEILATIDLRSTKTGAILPRLLKIEVLSGPYAGATI